MNFWVNLTFNNKNIYKVYIKTEISFYLYD